MNQIHTISELLKEISEFKTIVSNEQITEVRKMG